MDLDLLKNAAIFADLDDSELERVAEICMPAEFKFGQTIFKESEPGSGDVRVAQAVNEAHYNDLALVPSESSHPFPYLLAVHFGLT